MALVPKSMTVSVSGKVQPPAGMDPARPTPDNELREGKEGRERTRDTQEPKESVWGLFPMTLRPSNPSLGKTTCARPHCVHPVSAVEGMPAQH